MVSRSIPLSHSPQKPYAVAALTALAVGIKEDFNLVPNSH